MSRVSDEQIKLEREVDPSEFMPEGVSDIDWDIHALMEIMKRYEDKAGFEEFIGTLHRAKVLLEMKEGF